MSWHVIRNYNRHRKKYGGKAMKESKKKKFSLEKVHPYSIIVMVLIIAYICALLLPAGEFDRVEKNGEMVVVPGSFHYVEKVVPTPFDLLKSVQLGYIDSAQIFFFIVIAYAFVYIATVNGTMLAALGGLAKKLGSKSYIFIPVSVLIFGFLGATAGIYEEVYGLIPVFMGLAVALGYDSIVGGAIVFVGTATGFAAALTNPFTLGIAQGLAGVPLYS